MTMIALLGWLGAGALLAAYALVSARRLAGDGLPFQFLNITGGLALAVNSAYFGAWPSVALNAVWVTVGTASLVLRATRRLRPAREVPADVEA
jgi:hypothetical protein